MRVFAFRLIHFTDRAFDNQIVRPNYRSTKEEHVMAKVTHLGVVPPDDPIYQTGLVIGGKRFGNSSSDRPKSAPKPSTLDDLTLRRWAKLLEAEAIEAIENPWGSGQ